MSRVSVELRIPPSQPIDVPRLGSTIRTLVTLAPADAPIVSCYLEPGSSLRALARGEQDLVAVAEPAQRDAITAAFARIRDYATHDVAASTRGFAVFAREGTDATFVALQFRVPVPTHVSVGDVANVYHLIELKDTYDRYVVFITGDNNARILEVDLGAVTKELWAHQPELRQQVRDKWGRAHYSRRRRDSDPDRLDDELALLGSLFSNGRHGYLMLAGPEHRTTYVRNRLPPPLRQRLVDVHPIAARTRSDDIVAETLASFVATEQQESQDAVSELVAALLGGGLAVAGTQRTIDALAQRRADLLVLSKQYPTGPAWQCRRCGWIDTLATVPEVCDACGGGERMIHVERREALVRLAEQTATEIELVADSEPLLRVGGVGCLLRYPLASFAP